MFTRTWYAGNPVSEKNSSRKLADQARLPTPRYRIGVRLYECRFPRRTLLGSSVNRGDGSLQRAGASSSSSRTDRDNKSRLILGPWSHDSGTSPLLEFYQST